MNILPFIKRKATAAPEQRQADGPSWINLQSQGWGQPNARAAENLSAIFACVDVISSALASLPPRLYEASGTERRQVDGTSLFDGPNRWQTWPDFVSWYVAEALLFGNAVAVVRPDGELIPIRWQACGMTMRGDGSLEYDWQFGEGHYNLHGVSGDGRVMHMRDRTDDGITGRSRLSRCAATVGLAHDVLDAAIALWQNGAFPSGALKVPGRLPPDEKTRLRAQVEDQFTGSGNRAKFMLLDGGSEWERMDVDPKDNEALENRKFMIAEVCRIFEVPPPIVQDYENNTFTNASTAGQWFARFTLAGWARRFEAAFKRTLLPDNHHLELDMSAFARGDLKERWDAYKIALETGVLSPEDVKRLEGW